MRVYGEVYLFINFWMDFLSLLLAASLKQARFHRLRAALGATLGTVYSVLAWMGGQLCRGFPVLILFALMISLISFGKSGFFLFPYVAVSSLVLCGLSDALLRSGVSRAGILLTAGLFTLGLCLLQRKSRVFEESPCALRIVYRGKQASLPVLRDSGNLLRDGLTGQPVIVAPESALLSILPSDFQPGDFTALPPGWRLMPIRTASGNGLLMCFHADRAELVQNKRAWKIDAVIAVSGFAEKSALVPECLFRGVRPAKAPQKEVMFHAGN